MKIVPTISSALATVTICPTKITARTSVDTSTNTDPTFPPPDTAKNATAKSMADKSQATAPAAYIALFISHLPKTPS
jgi:hypothetical protein